MEFVDDGVGDAVLDSVGSTDAELVAAKEAVTVVEPVTVEVNDADTDVLGELEILGLNDADVVRVTVVEPLTVA